MKQFKWFVILAVIMLGLTGCEQKKDTVVDYTLLFGLWEKQGTTGDYMRFLKDNEEAKVDDYFFGKEWSESEDVKEKDLKYKGNGWFKWRIDGSSMIKIELMDNNGANIPKTYTVSKLTNAELVLQDPASTKTSTWNKKN